MWNAEDKEGLGRPAGGGKMPSGRGRKDNAKPYDRSSSSLFGRIYSTVKDYLVPSYYTYNLSGLNTKPDNGFDVGSDVQRNEVSGEEKNDKRANPMDIDSNQRSGREKNEQRANPMNIDSHQAASSIAMPLTEESRNFTQSLQRHPLELVRTSSEVNHSSGSQSNQSTSHKLDSRSALDDAVKHRPSSRLFERDLNGSECSDSSSSARVTGKFVSRLAMTSSDSNVSHSIALPASESFLWSSERNDAKKKTISSFDVSTFCESIDQTHSDVTKITPVKSSITSRGDGESLFYAGQTKYGGASATLKTIRTELSSSPYQRRNAVQQHVIAKPSGALGGAGITSYTSRRILDAMQRGEDSRSSIRNSRSRETIASAATSLTNASSTSIFHRNSAQFDATVNKDSLFANSFRAGNKESEVKRISATAPNSTHSPNFASNNSEIDQMINASENIRERSQDVGGKMKKAPKHYSCRGDDNEAIEPNPLLCTVLPLPPININPGLLGTTTSAATSVSFAFSMPKESITVETKSLMPSIANNVTKPMSVLDENAQFRIPSDVSITNTFKNGVNSSPSVSKTTSNASISLHSGMPLPPFGSKSVGGQLGSSSVTQCSLSDASFFNPTGAGGVKIGSSYNQYDQTKFTNDQSNRSTLHVSVTKSIGSSNATTSSFGTSSSKPTSGEQQMNFPRELVRTEDGLPNIIHDNLLSRPPLRDGIDVSKNSSTSSIVVSSNGEVIKNESHSSAEKIISVSKISAVTDSIQDSNVRPHCAKEASAVIPLSALFKKPVNVWTCDECYVVNKPDATACASCDSVRPGHAQSSLPTVVQDATRLPMNFVSASDKPASTCAMFSFGRSPKESAFSDGQMAAAPGFRPTTTGLFSFSSSSVPSSSSSGGIIVGNGKNQSMFNSTASINSNVTPNAPLFGSTANNASVPASLFSDSLNTTTTPTSTTFNNNISNAVPFFAGSNAISSNPASMFGGVAIPSSNTTQMFGGLGSISSSAAPVFKSVSNVASASSTFSDNNGAIATPKIEIPSAAVPVFSGESTAKTSTSGLNFSGFGGFSNNLVAASQSNSQSKSAPAPMFSFPATTTSSSTSLFTIPSAIGTMGSTTTTSSSKFNYTPPTAPIFGIPLSSTSTNVAPTFGMPANTMAVSSQFGAATTSTGVFSAAGPSTSLPFFGMSASTSSTPAFSIPTTTTTSNMFGQPAAPEKTPMFGTSTDTPLFGQQPNVPMFGQQVLQQPTATVISNRPSAPFRFGAPSSTTNSSSVFQMPQAVAPTPFFGMQSSVASTPSGFGASAFATPTFGAAKSDSFPANHGFGAPTPSVPFGSSNGMGSAVPMGSAIPRFGAAVGANSIFSASSTGNGQTGVIPMFGAVAPANGPSFAFGNGMQNSQPAPSVFTFGGGTPGNQFSDSSKIGGTVPGHSNKRGLDDGSNNGANPAKRSSDMFGNQTQNSNSFSFGSGQQQSAPPSNVWNQQQPSASANSNSNAFSATLPTAGFNFASAASQFNFPAAPTNNSGGVFQFGGAANQQSAPNPFGNASNVAQNPFNANNASNPFDIVPSNPNRVIKKAVRKTKR